MNVKTLFCAIFAAALVFGCTTTGQQVRATKQCPPAACDAVVTVDTSSGTPVVRISDDVLKMKQGDRDPIITWVLDAPAGFEFGNDSIAPHTGAPSAGKQTTAQQVWNSQIAYVTHNKTRYMVKNKNTASGTLYYDIKVYQPATGQTWRLDPAIMNDP